MQDFMQQNVNYRYYISLVSDNNPFTRPFTHTVIALPDIGLLNKYAQTIEGIHDFTTFSAAGDASESKIRAISSAVFFIGEWKADIPYKGKRFSLENGKVSGGNNAGTGTEECIICEDAGNIEG